METTECKTYLNYPRIIATDKFIADNNFSLKSAEDISVKMKNAGKFMDFTTEVFITFLPFDMVKSELQEDYVKKVEAGEYKWTDPTGLNEAVQDFLDYMNFAWGKAEDQRGISASRSVQKLGAWLWCFNREDLELLIHDDSLYNPYGAPALIAVCEKLGITVPESLIEFSKYKC